MSDLVEVEHHGSVRLLRLNRPEARNAVNAALARAIVEAVEAAQEARCIVLTGADPAFCAGLDLRDLGLDRLSDLAPFVAAIATSDTPVIAAVNGAAVTGGFEIALAADFIVASPAARFADTHVRVGVYPGPVLVDLPRRIGMAKAREMSLTGDFVDADTALRIGLINHLVPHQDLRSFALDLAESIAEQDPEMIRAMRHDWDETSALPLLVAHARHMDNARAFGSVEPTGASIAAHGDEVMQRARERRA